MQERHTYSVRPDINSREQVGPEAVINKFSNFVSSLEVATTDKLGELGIGKSDQLELSLADLRERSQLLMSGLAQRADYYSLFGMLEVAEELGIDRICSCENPDAIADSLDRSVQGIQGYMVVNQLLTDIAREQLLDAKVSTEAS